MEAEQVLAKINASGLDAQWKRYARAGLRRDAKRIADKEVEVRGKPASRVPDEEAHWGPRREAAQILYDRKNTAYIWDLQGLRRRPITHTYTNYKWGNPVVWVQFEYCLEDAVVIRQRWNDQRPNNRSRPWKKEVG